MFLVSFSLPMQIVWWSGVIARIGSKITCRKHMKALIITRTSGRLGCHLDGPNKQDGARVEQTTGKEGVAEDRRHDSKRRENHAAKGDTR